MSDHKDTNHNQQDRYQSHYRSYSNEEEEKASRREVDDLDRRFNRLEDKMSELTDAIISIARVEEKISIMIEDTKDVKDAVNSHTNRIHELEKNESKNSANLKFIASLFWLILGSATTAVTGVIISMYL